MILEDKNMHGASAVETHDVCKDTDLKVVPSALGTYVCSSTVNVHF